MQDVEHELTAQEGKDNKALAEGAMVDIEYLALQFKQGVESILASLATLGEGDVAPDIQGDDFFDLVDSGEDKLGINIKKQFEV